MTKFLSAAWLASELLSSQAADTTVHGCKCTNLCEAHALRYECEWCNVEGNCGHASSVPFAPHWDWCVYPADSFEAKSFAEKTDILWEKITADRSSGSYPSPLSLLQESVQTSFDNWKDTLPAGRKKAIHSTGAVCKFKFEITESSPYTGLLGPGVQEGLMRMGAAQPFDPSEQATPIGGMGFKFSRTGVHSGDFVAMHSTFPSGYYNFFHLNMSNHLPMRKTDAAQKLVLAKFKQASQCPTQVGLSDLARYSQDGTKHSAPKFPFKLFFVTGRGVQQSEGAKSNAEMLQQFTQIPVGTKVFHVYACGAAKDEREPGLSLEQACGKPLLLGDMVTTDKCTTSAFGDKELFIRHTRIEEDWELEPGYLSQYDAGFGCAAEHLTPAGAPGKCGEKQGMLDDDVAVVV